MKEAEEEENNQNYNYTTNYAFKLSNINDNNENNDNNDNNDVNTDSSKNKAVMKCNQEFLTFDKKNYPLILRDIIQKWEWENIAVEANLANIFFRNDDKTGFNIETVDNGEIFVINPKKSTKEINAGNKLKNI